MDLAGKWVVLTGGASGLGLATARRMARAGARVAIMDLPQSKGTEVASGLGSGHCFLPADVTDDAAVAAGFAQLLKEAPVAAVVHCAGRGGAFRVLDREGNAADPELFETILRINVMGSLNILRHGAAAMARNPDEEERGVVILTASIAAWEGQIGQLPYATSKGGIVSMTLVAARDLAARKIRVCSIAPGVFDTPILARLTEEQKAGLAKAVPHPARLGQADEFAHMVQAMIENPMLNGETIRLDGALRMGPR